MAAQELQPDNGDIEKISLSLKRNNRELKQINLLATAGIVMFLTAFALYVYYASVISREADEFARWVECAPSFLEANSPVPPQCAKYLPPVRP